MFSCLDSMPDVFDRGRPGTMLCGGSIVYLFGCLHVRIFRQRRRRGYIGVAGFNRVYIGFRDYVLPPNDGKSDGKEYAE